MSGNLKANILGLSNCDTCRKTRRALESAGFDVAFRDVRDTPLSAAERGRFLQAFGDRLVNRASTTWRGLSEEDRRQSSEMLLAAHPALMKRPLIAIGENLWLGWDAKVQASVLK